MSDEYGSVIEVSTVNVGTYFAADASIGATVLSLVDVSMFDELGGQCSIPEATLSNEYVYTAIDLTANTMTLLTGLIVAALADTSQVQVYPLAPVRTALVQFGIEEAEAVRVVIPHYFSGMPDGVRLANDQEVALVTERSPGELYLKDVAAQGMVMLGPGSNLDDYVSQGTFIQLHTADALLSLNYPGQTTTGAWAGFLEVLSTRNGTLILQRYTAYRSSGILPYPSTWTRFFAAGIWSAWVPLQDDSGWISSTGSIAVALTGWSITSGHLRQVGNQVSIQLYLTYTGAGITVPATGDIANADAAQMIAAYRPTTGFSQGGLGSGNNGRVAMWQVQSDGTITLTAVGGGSVNIATSDAFSIGGQYFLD